MESLLQQLVVGQVYAFMLVFVRIGTAVMIMPGVGDGFVPEKVRLMFALAFSAILTPVVGPALPEFTVAGLPFFMLLLGEFILGAFIGTIARIFMTALDTAGMFMSTQMGLANAQIFNPAFATQGSIMGAFMSITGALLLFATNLHHVLLTAVVDSYRSFPPGMMQANFSGDMAETISQSVTKAFAIGFHMAMPFIIVTTMIYVAMGILSRLMPQLQVFVLSMPVQILLGLLTFTLCASSAMIYWLSHYEAAITYFAMPAGGNG
ncbi:MAG: flagellar biosynthetic protein FliR [Alphaproteobacteria bacterium]|nr:flagellar biosynthetic protein FliR [Alphaproteobacteria bacterium]